MRYLIGAVLGLVAAGCGGNFAAVYEPAETRVEAPPPPDPCYGRTSSPGDSCTDTFPCCQDDLTCANAVCTPRQPGTQTLHGHCDGITSVPGDACRAPDMPCCSDKLVCVANVCLPK